MSITLTIELIELPEDERREQIENIGQNFPYIGDDPDELAHNLGEDASIMMQLYQKVLTHEQMDFLNRHEYVRTFNVREGGMYDNTTMDIEQIKPRLQELLKMRWEDKLYLMYPNLYPDSPVAQAEKNLNDELTPFGLIVDWSGNQQAYGIFIKEE